MHRAFRSLRRLAGIIAVGAVLAAFAACDSEPPVPASVPPDTVLTEPVNTPAPPPLPEAVIAMRETILEAARAGSLSQLSRIAEAQPAFLSNLGDIPHRRHWDLMRRTGFDPNQKLVTLFQQPYAARNVGAEVWFVWPDLAARSNAALQPGRLSFRDEARLQALIGPAGLEAVRNGADYPGMRTAISQTGQWRYFLHEPIEQGDAQ